MSQAPTPESATAVITSAIAIYDGTIAALDAARARLQALLPGEPVESVPRTSASTPLTPAMRPSSASQGFWQLLREDRTRWWTIPEILTECEARGWMAGFADDWSRGGFNEKNISSVFSRGQHDGKVEKLGHGRFRAGPRLK